MLPQNKWGYTALYHACMDGHVEIARALLDHGAYVEQQNKVFEFAFT
jgi:ankyrin repeat protein